MSRVLWSWCTYIHDHYPPQHSLHLVWLPSICGAWSFRGPEIFWPRDRRLGEQCSLDNGTNGNNKIGMNKNVLGDKNILALRAVLGWCQHLLLMMILWGIWWQIYIEAEMIYHIFHINQFWKYSFQLLNLKLKAAFETTYHKWDSSGC